MKNDGSGNLGIILKLKKNSVIVMTDKLDFVEINRKPGMVRGQKVYFTSFDLCNTSFWFWDYKKILKLTSVAASVAAVFLVLFVGYRFLYSIKEYAYVDIDINPSIEMTINKNENVLRAEALNSDGQTLLDAVKVKNMELADAVSLLLSKSKEIGFIDSYNNKVILTTALNSEKVTEAENEDLNSMISSLKEVVDKSGLESQVIQLSLEDRKEAIETGLSMCKYYIYTKAADEGIQMTVEEVKNSSISTLLNKVALLDDVNITQVPDADIEPTAEPLTEPTPSQIIENTPTKAPVVTVKPVYTSIPVTTPNSSYVSEFTPSPTVITEPSITPYSTNMPTQTSYYRTPTPRPSATSTPTPKFTISTPSPKPTITPMIPNRTFPVIGPVKTPTPRVTATKSPTPRPKPTTAIPTSVPVKPTATVPTTMPVITPVKRTPTPVVPTATPKVTITPSMQPTKPIDKPTPSATITSTPMPTYTPVSTPTLTPTMTPKITPTLTPSPTPTTVPTATPTEKFSMKLGMYNEERADNAKEIHPRFKLINDGNTSVKLSSIKIRYYYTIDIEDKKQVFYCDWSDIGRNSIKGKLVKMSSSKKDADYYLEIGFDTTKSIEPGESIEIACRIGPDNTIGDGNVFYNQLNDYSFNDTARDFISWDKATVYVSEFLLWGKEP